MDVITSRRGSALNVLAIAGPAFVLLVLLTAFGGISTYNSIQRSNIDVDKSWGQVQNVLQRRGDLIPNLVETVKGYAAHEKEVFTRVADARAKLAGARSPEEVLGANAALSSALSRLLVVVENYPTLKADTHFTRLMDELSGAENAIAVERMRYNEAIGKYNSRIKVFPNSLVAGMAGAKERPFFRADESAAQVPKVSFR